MKIVPIILSIFVFFFLTINVYAHVVVKPTKVGIGSFQTFTIGVPNEKDIATVGMRLIIPSGLEGVTPHVKQGWNIEVKKQGQGDDEVVTEIVWSDGSIPVGLQDDFLFSAQVPAQESKLSWKAYQTYADGSIVVWDKDFQTQVIDDLADIEKTTASDKASLLNAAAIIISLLALGISLHGNWKK